MTQRTNTKTRKRIFTARIVRPTRRRIFDSEAKDAKKTLEIFLIKVCFYYTVSNIVAQRKILIYG